MGGCSWCRVGLGNPYSTRCVTALPHFRIVLSRPASSPHFGEGIADRSEYNAAGLLPTGSHYGFSPAVGADASPTLNSTHAGACPCPVSADTARRAPSDRQSIGESWQDDGLPSLGYPCAAGAV